MAFVLWLKNLDKESVKDAGGKGANLAEMFNAGLPVPPAFIVGAEAYSKFLKEADLEDDIRSLLSGLDLEDTKQLQARAGQIREMIEKAQMSGKVREEIVEAYDNLNVDPSLVNLNEDALSIIKAGRESVFVAVRSSATAEDLGDASFAGQQETFLNIKGNAELIKSVKECWASLFTPRAIYYREKKGFDHIQTKMAVIVQKMIESEKAGVMFTVNPASNADEIIIEAGYGLGEGVVSGTVTPDFYVVDKEKIEIEKKEVKAQKVQFVRGRGGKTMKEFVSRELINEQVLKDDEITRLAKYGARIEKHYKFPQDIEWGFEDDKIYILQSRPVTTLKDEERAEYSHEGPVLLEGLGASPGQGEGVVKIVESLTDLDKVQKGDVLVTKMTNPSMVVTMQRAAAIVTDEGALTSHAAIVSREMGIPAIVGSGKATSVLQDGQMITVDGSSGKVYAGRMKEAVVGEEEEKKDEAAEEEEVSDKADEGERGEDEPEEKVEEEKEEVSDKAEDEEKKVEEEVEKTVHEVDDIIKDGEEEEAAEAEAGDDEEAAEESEELPEDEFRKVGQGAEEGEDAGEDVEEEVVEGEDESEDEGEDEDVEEDVAEGEVEEKPKEKPKVYMNLGEPHKISDYQSLEFEGIGLMRVEFVIASEIREHPMSLIEKGEEERYVEKLEDSISMVASKIVPKPVIVRFSDFKSNEYRGLENGEKFEQEEANPMLGFRGVSRYVSEDFEKAFRLECRAVKNVRDNYKNVWVMLPFVRTIEEVGKCLEIMKEEGLERGENFKIFLMGEVPSIVFLAKDFAALDVDGVSIGSNDLTQLVLGVDRDSAKLAKMGYFDERNEAVKEAIRILIREFHAAGKVVSICGQAPSVYDEFVDFLIEEGIDSISVNPDVVEKVREKLS